MEEQILYIEDVIIEDTVFESLFMNPTPKEKQLFKNVASCLVFSADGCKNFRLLDIANLQEEIVFNDSSIKDLIRGYYPNIAVFIETFKEIKFYTPFDVFFVSPDGFKISFSSLCDRFTTAEINEGKALYLSTAIELDDRPVVELNSTDRLNLLRNPLSTPNSSFEKAISPFLFKFSKAEIASSGYHFILFEYDSNAIFVLDETQKIILKVIDIPNDIRALWISAFRTLFCNVFAAQADYCVKRKLLSKIADVVERFSTEDVMLDDRFSNTILAFKRMKKKSFGEGFKDVTPEDLTRLLVRASSLV